MFRTAVRPSRRRRAVTRMTRPRALIAATVKPCRISDGRHGGGLGPRAAPVTSSGGYDGTPRPPSPDEYNDHLHPRRQRGSEQHGPLSAD